jgi:preprotein translocase subunit YajC
MKLITDAMAQTEQPAAPAETAPAPAPAPTPPHPEPTQTGTAAPGGAPEPNQPPSLPDLFAQLIPIFVVMGIVYILVIRPRNRREREQQAALRNVRRGDMVVTSGGVVCKVTRAIDDNEVEVEFAPNVRVRMLRTAIIEVRSRGEPVKEPPAPAATPAPAPAKTAPAKTSSNKSAASKAENKAKS